MSLQWIDRAPRRPDRYLDWGLVDRTQRGDTRDYWCSVLVQLWATPAPTPEANLERLQAELPGLLSPGSRTLNATADERSLLNRRIQELKSGALVPVGEDDPRLTFFVYMPESRAYTPAGGFGHVAGYYTIRLVGPPIPSLRIGQQPAATALAHMMLKRARPTTVAVGIIDHAIGFANERFRRRNAGGAPDGSRVRRLWLQTMEEADVDSSQTVLFGRRLDQRSIEVALTASASRTGVINEDAVYAMTGAVDFALHQRQATARRAGHGTHVMDLACGYAPEDASGATRPILAVQLPEPATLDASGVTMASYVLQGLRQIMLWADTIEPPDALPLVVNFSYGFYAGPKDGRHILEREMQRLIESRNATTPTVLVVPAGNTYLARVTAHMSLASGARDAVDWNIHPDCGTPSFLEIWLDDPASATPVTVQLAAPGAAPSAFAMPVDGQGKVLVDAGRPIGAIYFDAAANGIAGASARARIMIALNPTKSYTPGRALAPSGAWRVTLTNTSGRPVRAHLFVQRQEQAPGDEPPGRQSTLDHGHAYERDAATGDYDQLGAPAKPCPLTHDGSLTALSTNPAMSAVGAAFARVAGQAAHQPSRYTAAGPTPSRAAPDFAAVADEDRAFLGVLAAGTRSGSIVALDGTSIAAPQVTRALADTGADVAKLKAALGVAAGAVPDPRLGLAVVPPVTRADIMPRRR